MTNKKSTKKALLMSALSLLLCMSMLVGTTFAWFTDEVKSGNNIIAAGNLDIELYHSDRAVKNEKVNGGTKLFDDVSSQLWEPGAVAYEVLTVVNEGTLALKYNLAFHALNATVVNGKSLANVLKIAVVDASKLTSREAAIAAGAGKWTALDSFDLPGVLEAEESETYGIVIYWEPSSNDNDFNMNNENQGKILSVELGVHLTATQKMSEEDSFGDDYDKDAEPVLVENAADLAAALTANEEYIYVILGNDIDLPITSLGTITAGSGEYKLGGENTKAIHVDLNGRKLNITTTYWSNLGAKNDDAVITFANGTMTSSQATGTWNSYDLTFSNCKFAFENVTFEKAIALESSAVLKNVTINETHDYYAMWIAARGQTVEIDGLTINSNGRGIKIDEQYVDAAKKVTLKVSNATFNTNKKAAIMVKSAAGADITLNNVNIANTVDAAHAVWVDEDSAASYDLVTVTRGQKFYEGDVVSSSTGLKDALTNGETDIVLGAGDYSLPTTTGDVTISGGADTVITIDKPKAGKVTLKGVTVVGSGNYTGIQHSDTVVYEDCVVKGVQFLYANKVVFKNCTIDLTEKADYIWTYGAKEVEFIDCTFNTAGKALLIYSETNNLTTQVTVKGCTFNATQSALASGAIAAAIEIDSSLSPNGHYTLIAENNTVDSDFSGEWRIKKSGTDNTTVNGVIYNYVADGLYKGESNVFYVYNANGLEKMNTMMADKTAGRDAVVNLLSDIDFSGKTWTPVDSHADSKFEIAEINGNGHTISNLTINGQAMFRRFAGTGDVVIKDITFDGATVNSNGNINTAIVTGHTYQNVLLDNVDVKNSTITGGYKVAPLIATVYNENPNSTITATLKNCDVENVVVTATSYDFCTTGMVAFVYADDADAIAFENCSVKNVKLYAPNSYTAHAAVYTTGSETLFNEADGVTVTDVTFENK